MLLKDVFNDPAVAGSATGRTPGGELVPELVETEQMDDEMISGSESDVSQDPEKHGLQEMQDSGKTALYPEAAVHFPFKTADRLLDDIEHDLSFIDTGCRENLCSDLLNGIMKSPILSYSKEIGDTRRYKLGSLVDQVILQTKFEYDSVTCPQHNHLQVFLGVLVDIAQENVATFDDLAALSIFHLKVTVKTRDVLERTKKKAGVTHYHLLDETEIHPYDKQDLLTLDTKDPQLLDYAIYISSDSNKLILIEIFKPEFDSQDERGLFREETINDRYEKACKKFGSLDPTKRPTQPDCINTLLKIFKGPLNRKSRDEPGKTISPNNVSLNSHIDPTWLTSKYGFELHVEKDGETGEEILEYAPPDLIEYRRDWKVRKLRESFTRKCLELIFLGRISIRLLSQDDINRNPKVYRIFSMMQTTFSSIFWFQLLNEYRAIFNTENNSPFDSDYHFIDLSACYNYSDKDIIRNYETQCMLDPENIGVYVDALNFIANRKGAYSLMSYCNKQDSVGKEVLDQALAVFHIDPKDFDAHILNDNVILSLYKNEKASTRNPNRQTDLKNSLKLLSKFKKSPKLGFYADYEPYENITQAYEVLDVDESVDDDDIIQTAYTVKVHDTPCLKLDCDRALYTIAVHSRSLALFNLLMQQCEEFQRYFGPEKFSYQEALSILQVNENAGDDTILEIFQQKWHNGHVVDADQLLILKSALTKIGFERNSRLISYFLDTGTIDPSCLPAENWPTGLNNIGNTCYLNSLLQYYFSISSLRQYVLDYRKTVKHFLNNAEYRFRRIGGREITESEVERSVQFVYQLRDLFDSMIHAQERCVTPRKELAYLSFVPSGLGVEFELTTTSQTVEKAPVEKEKENFVNGGSGPLPPPDDELCLIDLDDKEEDNKNSQLNNFSSNSNSTEMKNTQGPLDATSADIPLTDGPVGGKITVASSDSSNNNNSDKTAAINTSTRVAKISSDQLENALEMGRQQDVTECIGNVLFQLESASDPIGLDDDNEQNDLVKQLFYGNIRQNIIPLTDETQVRTKYERFLSLLVNIGDNPKDIYDALDLYFQDEYLELEEYGDVKRTVSIMNFPTILQIQIQRVYYDRERLMPFKSIAPLPFTETIYMDRYDDTGNPVLRGRKKETEKLTKELNSLKSRQHELLSKNKLGLSRKGALIETSNFLKSNVLQSQNIEIADRLQLAEELDKIVSGIDNELSSLYQKINLLENKISHQFDDFRTIGYSLFAVFIHRGEASYGHYWIYIKDRYKGGIWRKYNDEIITEVPESEVFNFCEGNTATPYFLVYVKQGCEQEIEPLKRVLKSSV